MARPYSGGHDHKVDIRSKTIPSAPRWSILQPKTNNFASKEPQDPKIHKDSSRALLDLTCGPPLYPS